MSRGTSTQGFLHSPQDSRFSGLEREEAGTR